MTEISFHKKPRGNDFPHDHLFNISMLLGRQSGSMALFLIGMLIPLMPFIQLVYGLFLLFICIWLGYLFARYLFVLLLAGHDLKYNNLILHGILKIASSCVMIIAAIIFMQIYAMTWFSSGFSNFSKTYLVISLLGTVPVTILTILASIAILLDFASWFPLSRFFTTREQGKSHAFSRVAFNFAILQYSVAVLSIIFSFVDISTVPILFALSTCIGVIVLNQMSKAYRIYYYSLMSQISNETTHQGDILLDVKGLKTYFPIRGGFFSQTVGFVKAVDDVSFSIKRGETLALVGESGCGKTTIGRTLLGLVNRRAGEVVFDGRSIPKIFPPFLRRRIQFIFQDPDASLNPRMNIYQIISEPLINLNPDMSANDIKLRVLELTDLVSLKYEHLYRFPHEFSGGQKQRIVIARALACYPEFIALDEPTSALDVSVQAQILNLLKDLQKKLNLSFLFITHNLSVVHHIASRVAVMYLGKIVEIGPVDRVFDNPLHPYTKALLSARSIPDPERARNRIILKGDVPSPVNPPAGCPFHPRCFYEFKSERCRTITPQKVEIEPDHFFWTSMANDSKACWMQ